MLKKLMDVLTFQAIAQNPDILTRRLDLPAGEQVVFRLIRADDGERLGRYFEGLSAATRRLYAPHPFDLETAKRLCAEVDYRDTLRFVAVSGQGNAARIIAYFIVKLGTYPGDRQRYEERGLPLDEATTCSLAPSVSDAHQSQGVGSAMMPFILEIVRRLGYRQMILQGGTRAENHRAIHFYEKHGFRWVGDFKVRDLDNRDMILDLCPPKRR